MKEDAATDDGGTTNRAAVITRTDEDVVDTVALASGVGAISVVSAGDPTVLCPDCVELPPEQCPSVCRRAELRWSVYDETGTTVAEPVTLATIVLPALDQQVGSVDASLSPDGRLALAWQRCVAPPARSCTTFVRWFHLDGSPASPTVVIAERRYGDVKVVTATHRVLVARSSDLATRAGVEVAIFDDAGGVIAPWRRIGSSRARRAAVGGTDAGFLVAVEDSHPGTDDATCPPCATLPECLGTAPPCASGPVEPGAGIVVYEVDLAGGIRRGDPVSGWDGVTYHAWDRLAIAASSPLAIIAWWPADRSMHVRVRDPAWRELARYASPDDAPGASGVVRTGDRLRWVAGLVRTGPQLSDTRARLVTGVIDPGADAQVSELDLELSGFFVAGSLSADARAAYLAAAVIGERPGPDGYDHHAIIRIAW